MSRKERFLASIPTASIELENDTLAMRSKFNFSYFCVQQNAGEDFGDWTLEQQTKLLVKLKEYSGQSLSHWQQQRVGKSGRILSIYGSFPSKSDFIHPEHVPHQAQWGRFRLEQSVRLVGFVLPNTLHNTAHSNGALFDCNTFYVVFLDKAHRFYRCGDEAH